MKKKNTKKSVSVARGRAALKRAREVLAIEEPLLPKMWCSGCHSYECQHCIDPVHLNASVAAAQKHIDQVKSQLRRLASISPPSICPKCGRQTVDGKCPWLAAMGLTNHS